MQIRKTANKDADVLQPGKSLKHPMLPIVSDAKEHWVPLELLMVMHAQAVRCKMVASATRNTTDLVLSSPEHEPKLKEAGKKFLDSIIVRTRGTV
jgi:hypothetical protein